MRAMDVMRSDVLTLPPSPTVAQVVRVLRSCSHNGFPVLTPTRTVLGLVLRSQLLVLLRNQVFTPAEDNELSTGPAFQATPRRELNMFDFRRWVCARLAVHLHLFD